MNDKYFFLICIFILCIFDSVILVWVWATIAAKAQRDAAKAQRDIDNRKIEAMTEENLRVKDVPIARPGTGD